MTLQEAQTKSVKFFGKVGRAYEYDGTCYVGFSIREDPGFIITVGSATTWLQAFKQVDRWARRQA